MASRNISDLDPILQPICQEFLDRCNKSMRVFLTCTYRGNDEQNSDYEKGRTENGPIITNARAGQSPHNCTLDDGTPAARGFDFAIEDTDGVLDWNVSDSLWQAAISIGEELGLKSGYRFKGRLKDGPHFELPNWETNPTPWHAAV